MPSVLNLKDYNYRLPAGSVYVGRANSFARLPASRWANPFRIGEEYQGEKLTRSGCIEAYQDWLQYSEEGRRLLLYIRELEGQDLVCWCHTWNGQGPNPLFCHADVLLEMANEA